MKYDIHSEKFATALEIIVVILLGITAVMTAYASWQASLYDGNQASYYTQSNSTLGEANSLYNEANQYLAQDMDVWNRLNDLRVDLVFAQNNNDTASIESLQYKIDTIMYDNVGADLAAAIEWADQQTDYASPFDQEGFTDSYYTDASAKYQEGLDFMDMGSKANDLGDIQGLVTVVYSVVLFLLGIVGTFKNVKVRLTVTAISSATLIYGIITMLTVPMLTPGA